MEYESEADFGAKVAPRSMIEIIGVAKSDAIGAAAVLPFSFQIVAHTGSMFYMAALSEKEMTAWMVHIRAALECNFANPEVVPYKPSKEIYEAPLKMPSPKCAKTGTPLGSSYVYCKGCGRVYLPEFVNEPVPMLQLNIEEAMKVCESCYNAQVLILWLKALGYANVAELHERTPSVLSGVQRFKSSFRLRRFCSQRLDMAAQLLESGQIELDEFEELRRVDHDYRCSTAQEETDRLKIALDALGNDVQTMISILSNPNSTSSPKSQGSDIMRNGNMMYLQVVIRLLEIGDKEPDLLDFFWPQLIQIHLLMSKRFQVDALMKVDILQSALLATAMKYPHLAIKLAWSMIGSISDYKDKKISETQFASCVALLVQLEIVTTGTSSSLTQHKMSPIASHPSMSPSAYRPLHMRSPIAAVSGTRFDDDGALPHTVLASILTPSIHQQHELIYELYTLFKARALLNKPHREKRFESMTRHLDDCRRGWSQLERGETLEHAIAESSKEAPKTPTPGDFDAKKLVEKKNKDRIPTVVDLMFHFGCMDYSKLAFPMPMAGGGLMNGHIFANVASDMSFKHGNDLSVNNNNYSSESLSSLSGVMTEGSSKSRLSTGDSTEVDIEDANVSNKEKLESGGSYDYDYIAEWVNHRSDEMALQIDFIDKLTEHVDALRFVDRPQRTERLKLDLLTFQAYYMSNGWMGFDPTGSVTEPRYRIERILIEDCRVFRTKARAPSMIVCVVKKDESEVERFYKRDATKNAAPHAVSAEGGLIEGADTSMDRSTRSERVASFNSSTESITDGVTGRGTIGGGNPSLFHRNESNAIKAAESAAVVDVVIDGIDATTLHQQIVSLQANQKARAGAPPSSQDPSPTARPRSSVVGKSGTEKRDSLTGSSSALSLPTYDDSPVVDELVYTEARKSRLAAHSKSSSMLVHNRSIEKEIMSSFGPSEVDMAASERPSTSNSASVILDGEHAVTIDAESPVAATTKANDNVSSEVGTDSHTIGVMVQSRSTSDLENSPIAHAPSLQRAQSCADGSSIKARHHHEELPGHQFAHVKKEVAADNIIHTDISDKDESSTEVTKKVVSSAKELLDSGAISEREYEMLLRCDNKYRDESHRNEIDVSNQRIYDCFGESWVARKERIIGDLVYSSQEEEDEGEEEEWPMYDLRCFIVKSNDDLRQEVCCLQLIELCQEIFSDIDDTTAGCKLWLKTYRIISTNATTGIVQVIPDSQSLDALKKTEGFTTLKRHFDSLYGICPERYKIARRNFVASLAAYSLVTYIFQIKDRHNGNILIDKEGHIIHIDFGFLLGIAPGGSFSIESAPFKLTEEMVEVFGGLESPLFSEFLKVFTSGFLALKANSETILSTIALMAQQSTFPCFTGRDANLILDKLRGRFRHDLNVSETVQHCLDLIIQSYGNYGTKQYDNFQWLTNGIMP